MNIVFKVRKNPTTCAELSALIGYPVRRWTSSPECPFDLDLDVPSLTPGQRQLLLRNLEAALHHLVEDAPAAEVLPEPEPVIEPPPAIDIIIT